MLPSISPVQKRKLKTFLLDSHPDLIISVHPLMNHLFGRLLRSVELDCPLVTVVTDMVTIHPAWIYPKVDFCIVPTEPAQTLALKFGMPAEKLAVLGQPVSLKFAQAQEDKAKLRQELGLSANKKAILVVGGGEGFGRMVDIAQVINQQVENAQIVLVAGRNKSLKSKLEAIDWQISAKIYGFVDFMPALMSAVDIIVTKAGPGTLSEAFIAGLPIIISGYIPGQEVGNVSYVQAHNAGVFAQKPSEIAQIIRNCFQSPEQLQTMAQNSTKLAQPQASLKIAAKVCNLI